MDFLNTGQDLPNGRFSYCLERPAGGKLPAGCQKINPVKSLEGFGVSRGSRAKKATPKANIKRKYGELGCVKSLQPANETRPVRARPEELGKPSARPKGIIPGVSSFEVIPGHLIPSKQPEWGRSGRGVRPERRTSAKKRTRR